MAFICGDRGQQTNLRGERVGSSLKATCEEVKKDCTAMQLKQDPVKAKPPRVKTLAPQ